MNKSEYKSTDKLWVWSDNYDFPTPFTLFLDIIGWNDSYFAGKIANPMPQIGYVEADLLGNALVEYADNPEGVFNRVTEIMFLNQPELPFEIEA